VARRRKVRTSSLSRSETDDGRPAKARATLRSSRTRCWNVAASARRSSRATWWTSSIVTSSPVPWFSSASSTPPSSSRHAVTTAGAWLKVRPPPTTGRVTPVMLRPRWLVGSCSRESIEVAAERRSMRPGVAVSAIVTQARWSAVSATSVSITVLPTPRAPVKIVSRPGAPGPSSRDSANSSRSSSRPTSRGGVAPAVGLNGLRATVRTPLQSLHSL